MTQKIGTLIVDTTAFIQNAPLHEIATNITTTQDVVDEITNKRQLRRLVVLPYDLNIKDVFAENIKVVTEFSKKTGDYPSLSATDIKVMALTYQLEKEKVGTEHLRTEPIVPRSVNVSSHVPKEDNPVNVSGFYLPGKKDGKSDDESSEGELISDESDSEEDKDVKEMTDEPDTEIVSEDKTDGDLELINKITNLSCDDVENEKLNEILVSIKDEDGESEESSTSEYESSDDEDGWITPANVQKAKKQMDEELVEEKSVAVACITTDFAMQNVLKQMGLNVAALDGRMIKQIRTFILRCHTCFKTTSIMEKIFCPKCGNKTLKKVAVSVDENGKQQIHINARKPLTARGKKFSLPTPKGGKHSNNPILTEDQPIPQQRISNQARIKNNPLDPDYIAGYSPFVTRDVNSRSAMLGIRPGSNVKHWMKKNPNEANRRRK